MTTGEGNGTSQGGATRPREDAETMAADEALAPTEAGEALASGDGAAPRSGSLTATSGSLRGASSVSPTAGPSPYETLRQEEIKRMRFYLRLAIAMCAIVALSTILVPGEPVARWVLYAGLGTTTLGCAWMLLFHIDDEDDYTVWRSLVVAYCSIFGAFAGVYFFGPFSPGPVIIPFGVFFFSLSQDFRATLAVYLSCAFIMLGLFVGDMTDTFANSGIVQDSSLTLFEQLAMILLVEVIFLATYLLGRATRAASLRAIDDHSQALRSLAQREALLMEARRDLDRALRAGGIGRFTDQVLGSFRLGNVLGRGAMGEVYEAVHVQTEQPAAVKLLQVHMLGDATFIRRFSREAQIAASLDVQNVVRVFEVSGPEDAVPYIAMERLHGTDLSDHLRQHVSLSLDDTVRLAHEVARGLDVAHAAGVVHRDLKPANLFRTRAEDGKRVWKILDFGVSKLTEGADATLTRDNALVGTPEYMAPEQARGGQVSARTDIHALSVICYRALTGRPAFGGDESVMQLLLQVINDMPPRPSALRPGLPADVDAALLIGMAKDPADRYESARDLARALADAARGELDPALRERARAIAASQPWSQDLAA